MPFVPPLLDVRVTAWYLPLIGTIVVNLISDDHRIGQYRMFS